MAGKENTLDFTTFCGERRVTPVADAEQRGDHRSGLGPAPSDGRSPGELARRQSIPTKSSGTHRAGRPDHLTDVERGAATGPALDTPRAERLLDALTMWWMAAAAVYVVTCVGLLAGAAIYAVIT